MSALVADTLKELRSEMRDAAAAEPSHKWGDWDSRSEEFHGSSVFIVDSGIGTSYVASDISQGADDGKASAHHIVTTQPKNIMSLLELTDKLEFELDSIYEVLNSEDPDLCQRITAAMRAMSALYRPIVPEGKPYPAVGVPE